MARCECPTQGRVAGRRAGRAMNPSTALARVLVDELVACGLTEAVLAPGSRNAPLALALHEADAAGRLRLHVRIDERTAGFLAVGLARGSGRPVVVVTTSGTAVANLHPAVLESPHGQVPLIVLSADRPPWLRDVGANQAIDQHGIFGPALRFFHEFAVPQARPDQQAHWRSMAARGWSAAAGSVGWSGRTGPPECAADRTAAPGRRPDLAGTADRPGRALDRHRDAGPGGRARGARPRARGTGAVRGRPDPSVGGAGRRRRAPGDRRGRRRGRRPGARRRRPPAVGRRPSWTAPGRTG